MTLRTLFPRVPTHAKKQTNAQLSQQEWLRHAAAATPAELFCELNSGEEGLRAGQVDEARAFWGANATTQAAKRPAPLRLLAAFADPFTYILVFIALVSVLTDWVFADAGSRDVTTPLIIGVMVLVSGVLRFVQDEKSTVAAESLAEMIETLANVERDGDGGNPIPLDEVVVGDVVHLSSGDVVPADLRIFAARDLFVSQSSLTGESEPVEKRASLANPRRPGRRHRRRARHLRPHGPGRPGLHGLHRHLGQRPRRGRCHRRPHHVRRGHRHACRPQAPDRL